MRMTLEEALACPRDMTIEEYSRQLKKQEKRNKRLKKLSYDRD